jgi:hypothetical protein
VNRQVLFDDVLDQPLALSVAWRVAKPGEPFLELSGGGVLCLKARGAIDDLRSLTSGDQVHIRCFRALDSAAAGLASVFHRHLCSHPWLNSAEDCSRSVRQTLMRREAMESGVPLALLASAWIAGLASPRAASLGSANGLPLLGALPAEAPAGRPERRGPAGASVDCGIPAGW